MALKVRNAYNQRTSMRPPSTHTVNLTSLPLHGVLADQRSLRLRKQVQGAIKSNKTMDDVHRRSRVTYSPFNADLASLATAA